MTSKVVQFREIGLVTFQKNRRSKSIKIRVKPDRSVHVSYPWYVLTAEAVRFVNKNFDWVIRHQQKFGSKKSTSFTAQIIHSKFHKIEILKAVKNEVIDENGNIRILVEDFESEKSKEFAEKIITGVYRKEAGKILPDRLMELAIRYGFSFAKVTIRNNKRNWGSCARNNNISLNLQMMKLPDELIDYILLHELVHTTIKNHGPEFWAKMNELTSNKARMLAKQVRSYSTAIF